MSFFGFLKKTIFEKSPSQKSSTHSTSVPTQEILDFPLGETKFRELLLFSEEKELKLRLPSLRDCKVLEIAPKLPSFSSLVKPMTPSLMARVGGHREKELSSDDEVAFVISHWDSLPFIEGSWDFILLRPQFLKTSLSRILREASRILKPGGMILLSDFHPFSQLIQKDHLRSLVTEDALSPGFEKYFKFFKEAGLTVDSVKEFFYDGSVRKLFQSSDHEKELFESLRKTPFLIFFLLQKE